MRVHVIIVCTDNSKNNINSKTQVRNSALSCTFCVVSCASYLLNIAHNTSLPPGQISAWLLLGLQREHAHTWETQPSVSSCTHTEHTYIQVGLHPSTPHTQSTCAVHTSDHNHSSCFFLRGATISAIYVLSVLSSWSLETPDVFSCLSLPLPVSTVLAWLPWFEYSSVMSVLFYSVIWWCFIVLFSLSSCRLKCRSRLIA